MRRESAASSALSQEHVTSREVMFLPTLRISANDHESTTSIDHGVTNTF